MTDPTREQILERIAEIKRRSDEATEGPWEAKCIHVFMDGRGQYRVGARNRPGGFKGTVFQRDAEFVASARDDVPWLLEQLQVLQDRIAKAAQILRDCAHDSDGMCGYGQKALAVLDGEGEDAPKLREVAARERRFVRDSTEDAAYDKEN